MNLQNILRFVAFALVAFDILIQANTYPGQRAYHNGMRYGRAENVKKLGTRRTMLVPGGERFIMGTRYGKRSSLGELPDLLIYPIGSPGLMEMKAFVCGKSPRMLCTYTGMGNLYRCNQSYRDETDAKDTLPDGSGEQLKE